MKHQKAMIKIETSKDMCCLTHSPLEECMRAKNLCDLWKRDNPALATVQTVSSDAIATYLLYGRDTLGLDIHLYINGEEKTEIEDVEDLQMVALGYLTGEIMNKKRQTREDNGKF